MHITIRHEIMPYHIVKQQATLNILILKRLHIWIPLMSHKLTYTYFCESALIGQFHQVVWLIGSWVNFINQRYSGCVVLIVWLNLFQMQFMLLFSRQGKLRLQKWYVAHPDKLKKKITRELITTILARKPKMCSFLEWKDLKIVYKR